ncbi:AMP-binding protein [Micrococcus luteus]
MPATADALARATDALATAFDGGAPVELTADGAALPRPEARDPRRCGHPDAAAVVRTSGSTGTPKQIVLTASALRASAAATAERLATAHPRPDAPGTGHWLLAVSPHYVAGLAVLSRAIDAGTEVLTLPAGPFTPPAFTEAASRLPDDGRALLVSLVPTQVSRLLASDADPAGVEALRRFDHVLVGGARLPAPLRAAAEAAGVRLTATYGMAETCGGCVYDGRPLPGVTADLVRVSYTADGVPSGRIRLSGPMVAAGYLDDPERTAAHFTHDDASPASASFLTEDLGRLSHHDDGPCLTVTSRADDVVITGGVKVSAAAVQAVLEADPAVADVFVGAVEDPEWGQRLCAAVVPSPGAQPWGGQTQKRLAVVVKEALGGPAAPKTWLVLDALPLLSTGKPDRRALSALFAAAD